MHYNFFQSIHTTDVRTADAVASADKTRVGEHVGGRFLRKNKFHYRNVSTFRFQQQHYYKILVAFAVFWHILHSKR